MYIPMLEIPGCQPGYKNYNRSSRNPLATPTEDDDEVREPVTIRLSSLPTYEAVAEFYSYIAYPDPEEATQRENYRIALARWAVQERASLDPHWGRNEQAIRPNIFSQKERLFEDTRRSGGKRLWERCHCAFMMLLPHLVEELLEGLTPTVSHIALTACRIRGNQTTSQKTYEAKIWAPVKPVAHAAAAAMVSWVLLNDPEHGWDENHQLCYKQPVLATLFYEDVFRNFLLRIAELLRIQVPACSRFQIREADTIRFIAG
jgi:hypothetical protein